MKNVQWCASIMGMAFLLNISGTAFSKTVDDMATLEKEALAPIGRAKSGSHQGIG